jgi:glutathione S-transferase
MHRSEAYLARSPFGKMPVLETDDDGVIFESTSIVEYLEVRRGRRLIPEDHGPGHDRDPSGLVPQVAR